MMYDITDYGATVAGKAVNTKAIQAAIDACCEAGGGTVCCPAGIFYTGTIWLKDNVNLHLESGCVLKACTEKEEYNRKDCFKERDIVAHQNANGTHLIIAYKVSNISITGNGTIDGNCQAFFTLGKTENKSYPGHAKYNMPEERPGQMLYFCRCTNIKIKDIAMDNACFWTVYMLGCEKVMISGISISVLDIPNGDGLHFNCCRNVVVSDCDIDSSDDCLVFRGHYAPLGENIPCENVTVSNCLLKSDCCAIRIGVGDGIVRNCQFSNLVFHNTRHGINIMPSYSERYPRGTDLDNINFNNITMDVAIPVYMCNCGRAAVGNINFSNLNVNMTQAVIICGDAENNYRDVTIRDSVFNINGGVQHELYGMYISIPECSFFIRNTTNMQFKNVSVKYRMDARKVDAVFYLLDCTNQSMQNIDYGNYIEFAETDIINK